MTHSSVGLPVSTKVEQGSVCAWTTSNKLRRQILFGHPVWWCLTRWIRLEVCWPSERVGPNDRYFEKRRIRGDLIETFKVVTGREKVKMEKFFQCNKSNYSLQPPWSPVQDNSPQEPWAVGPTTTRSSFFSQRVVNIWNSLPTTVNCGFCEFSEQVQEWTGWLCRVGHIKASAYQLTKLDFIKYQLSSIKNLAA